MVRTMKSLIKKQIRKLKRGKELLIVGSYEKRNEDLFVVI